MQNSIEYPKVRPLEATPTILQNKRAIMLRDPSSISDKVLILSEELFFLVSLMDGTNRVLDLQVNWVRKFGTLITSDKIQELISQLDDALFLESENFTNYLNNLKNEYSKAKTRHAYLWGKAYPSDVSELSTYLYNLLKDVEKKEERKKPKGIISPHIDYQRGGKCYAWAYSELMDIDSTTTFIIFGTSHFQSEPLFILTKKDFETPFGILKNDIEFIEELEKKLNKDLCKDEFAHRNEHSIELQTIFLKYIFQQKDIKIVPVLCGSFHQFIKENKSPAESQEVQDFLSAIKDTVSSFSKQGKSIFFIAGADLSHIGLNFGDRDPVNYGNLDEINKSDMEMLKYVENLDAEGFYNCIAEEKDRRRICGLPPIYLLLKVIDAKESKLLNYDFWFERSIGSFVSFASLGFY